MFMLIYYNTIFYIYVNIIITKKYKNRIYGNAVNQDNCSSSNVKISMVIIKVLGGGVEPTMTRMKILDTEPLYDPSIYMYLK